LAHYKIVFDARRANWLIESLAKSYNKRLQNAKADLFFQIGFILSHFYQLMIRIIIKNS